MNLDDSRVIFIEKDGKYVTYSGDNERDSIEEYADTKRISYVTPKSIVDETNSAIFVNLGSIWVYGYLPDHMSKEQLDTINTFIELCFDNVKCVEMTKYGKEIKKYSFTDNIKENLGEIVSSSKKENRI